MSVFVCGAVLRDFSLAIIIGVRRRHLLVDLHRIAHCPLVGHAPAGAAPLRCWRESLKK